MKTKLLVACAIFTAVAAIANPAEAARGYTVETVNLRAGPAKGYPIVARLPGRAKIDVKGCVRDWSWCDISWHGYRGWVNGQYIRTSAKYKNSYIIQTGPTIGVPVIGFRFGNYWDTYYRGHDFYRDRSRYSRLYDNRWDDGRDHDWNDNRRDRDWDNGNDRRRDWDDNDRRRDHMND